MRAVVQRVIRANVQIGDAVHASIGSGLMVLLGIEEKDGPDDIRWQSNKLVNLRIFNDVDGVMNCSLTELGGELLLISQFTLFAATKKGNRPSYIRAAKPEIAIPLYELMVLQLEKDLQRKIQTGVFGADMQVELVNDGPVTIYFDTKQKDS